MQTLENIASDFEKVVQTQQASSQEIDNTLQTVINVFTDARNNIARDPSSVARTIALLKQKTTATAKLLSTQQEEVRRHAMRHEKTLRSSFRTDLNNIWDPRAFDGKEDVLNKTLAMHFIREGRFDLAQQFVQEAGLDVPPSLTEQFSEMYQILEAMKQRNLEPAIRWAAAYREELQKRSSSLEFQLHRLQFLKHLTEDNAQMAMAYAKLNFSNFASSHMKGMFAVIILYMRAMLRFPSMVHLM